MLFFCPNLFCVCGGRARVVEFLPVLCVDFFFLPSRPRQKLILGRVFRESSYAIALPNLTFPDLLALSHASGGIVPSLFLAKLLATNHEGG